MLTPGIMPATPISVTLDSVLVRSPEVTHQTVGDEAVLLDFGSEAYFGLNEVSLRFWEALNGVMTLAQVVDQLLPTYDVDRARMEHDVLDLATRLMREGLVVPAGRR